VMNTKGNTALRRPLGKRILDRWQLYLLLFLPLVFLIVFSYVPMYGVVLAFKDYKAGMTIAEAPWVGLEKFTKFLTSFKFTTILRNTLALSFYSLATFPIPIIFALMLNAMPGQRYKKLIQTVTYLPYFISTVIMIGIILSLLNERTGAWGSLYMNIFGRTAPNILAKGESFRHIYVWSGVWQSTGSGAVIYLAALSGVDPNLHEAAMIDGASRWQRVIHIDLPTILQTVSIMLILAIGNIMSVGADKALLMQNSMNMKYSEIISTYEYKIGLSADLPTDYSLSTAIGLFNSIINFILLIIADRVAKKLDGSGIF
jgi:putative aldouronate transport system permease protein